jgi:hypothetical protein
VTFQWKERGRSNVCEWVCEVEEREKGRANRKRRKEEGGDGQSPIFIGQKFDV